MYRQADLNFLCNKACPQQCNQVEYILSQSIAFFPEINYLKILLEKDNNYNPGDNLGTWAQRSVLKLVVNYENLYYTSLDENPAMDSTSLFGFLGGQLGILY